MDALSDVLRVVRLTGGVFLEADFTAPWCVSGQVKAEHCRPYHTTPRHVIAFHFVADGRMRIAADGGAPIEVSAREIVLLPAFSRAFKREFGTSPAVWRSATA